MSRSEMLMLYDRMARAGGTEVEFLKDDDLADRLASILPELNRFCDLAGSIQRGITSKQPCRIAAFPASGWPDELLESVQKVFSASGYEIVTPGPIPGGFAWDRDLIARASLGITFCPAFLAYTGSLVVASGTGMGTLASLLPEIHIAISYEEGCRGSLADYFEETGLSLPSRLTLITGPSRTGDIEATMTTGVHGPRRVLHFILGNSGENKR